MTTLGKGHLKFNIEWGKIRLQLSDRDIINEMRNQNLHISNIPRELENNNFIQPSSVDLTLGSPILRFNQDLTDPIYTDIEEPNMTYPVSFTHIKIRPGEFILGTTRERVTLPRNISGRIEGKSSIGRLGLIVHATAGFIDPGFDGQLTLEITNFNNRPIELRYGMKICQVSFYYLNTAAQRTYGHPELNSKYQGQIGPDQSKYHLNY